MFSFKHNKLTSKVGHFAESKTKIKIKDADLSRKKKHTPGVFEMSPKRSVKTGSNKLGFQSWFERIDWVVPPSQVASDHVHF